MACCLDRQGLDWVILLKGLSFPNSCFISLMLYCWHQGRPDYVLQREQRETYSHCTSASRLVLLSPSGYLWCKTNCIKSNSSLFLRPIIMHSQTTNKGVGCDGVNICCYYSNYAFHVDLHVIVTNKTQFCSVNCRVWTTRSSCFPTYTFDRSGACC